ncbi:MAG: methionine adenosyltransferase [Erysipelotrichia bacterium]|nr:methionine adenosyltransferase [Erysipelotrichia bacterium]
MKLYSNEIVFRGHPDKVCDQISDAILDACLSQDKNSRCGIETVGGKGKIFITGEVTTNAVIDVEKIAKQVLQDVGYSDNYEIINNLGMQSADIALGTNSTVGGAGDNGMMFGYACDDNNHYLPNAMVILQKLSQRYDQLRKEDQRFLPDGKAQITGYYDQNNKLQKIKTFTICYQNTEKDRIHTDQIIREICQQICKDFNMEIEEFLINPTGKFLIGGFEGDAGLTGRKIVVDSYQSFAPVGGGAFSGKDPSKVDRSAAYKAREIAVEYLKKYNLHYCQVQLSYAIGKAEPLAIYITSDKGDIEPNINLYQQCSVNQIINDLDLLNKNYQSTAMFGHFR